MNGESLNILQDNLRQLEQFFPQAFSEGKLDIERFKALFTEDVAINNERYVLNWAGKSDAFKVLQVPTTATVQPQPEESVGFDDSDNIFIEGENLEVLKVLQKSYYGKIKCIIIDPPYNTGNDSFIYPDSFKESKADYEKRIGDRDEEGNLLRQGAFRKNTKDSGHYHSNWLSMMYPRLFLAKNLLREDGVIFVHIDDNEVHNLRLIMNEIFGEENFVAQVVIETATDNNPSLVSSEHEYVLVFSKNKGQHTIWSRESEKAKLLQERYNEIKSKISRPADIQIELRKWIRENIALLDGIEHYNNVDEKGIFHDADIANPKFGGYFYDVIHPVTGKACKIPEKGFRYPKETLEKLIKEDDIMFGIDETVLIKPKKRLDGVRDVFRSVIYNDGRAASRRLSGLMGRDVFKFPKDEILEKKFLGFVSESTDIILDFFAGSGTTAQAVMELNKEDGGNRKFILVQLPELCDAQSEAYKAGYKTIADISRERIRRVIARIQERKAELAKHIHYNQERLERLQTELDELRQANPALATGGTTTPPQAKELLKEIEQRTEQLTQHTEELAKIQQTDVGFKAFALAPSNFKIWRSEDITQENIEDQLSAFANPVKEEAVELNVLYELLLKAGYQLTERVEKQDNLYLVRGGEFILAIESINTQTIEHIIALHPQRVVALDKLFDGNDQLKTNTVLQLREAGIEFRTV